MILCSTVVLNGESIWDPHDSFPSVDNHLTGPFLSGCEDPDVIAKIIDKGTNNNKIVNDAKISRAPL